MFKSAVPWLLLLSFQNSAAEEIVLTKVPKIKEHDLIAETPVFRYCKNPPTEEVTALRRDVASGRAGQNPREESEFLKADVLQIPIHASGATCNESCRAAISHAALVSLGLWRSGCSRCKSENLQVVSINGAFWVDSISLAKWRFALENGIPDTEFDPHAIARRSFRPLGRQPVVDFVNVRDHSTVKKICTSRNRIDIDPAIETTLCSKSPDLQRCETNACLELPIQVGKARSDCKMSSETIACGTPDLSIGLNTEDFVLVYNYDGESKVEVKFGSGHREVSLLYALLHEMGHWFGLPHDEYANERWPINIMSAGYRQNQPWCVSEWNLIQLDNAVDLGWTPRLHRNTGLKYVAD